MNFKKLALAAAAAAAATSAQAADLPMVAEPVNYVQACDAFGSGYFQLPGQSTCIRVHGRIRTNIVSHDLNDGLGDVTTAGSAAQEVYVSEEDGFVVAVNKLDDGTYVTVSDDPADVVVVDAEDVVTIPTEDAVEEETNDYSAYARGYLYFDSMTNTDFATIKTYMELTATHNQSGDATVGMGDVFLQLGFNSGSLLIGNTSSQFDSFTGYTWIAPVSENYSDSGVLQVSYTADLGNGLSLIASVEDANARGGVSNRADFVGALAVSQGWGSAKLAAATHAYGEDDYGYAVTGSVTVAAMDGIEASFQAQYADQALSYIGADVDGFTDAGGATGYNIGGGLSADLSDKVSAMLDFSYLSLDQDDADYNRTALDASVVYSPVEGLAFAVAAGWADDSEDQKETKVGARVQYTF